MNSPTILDCLPNSRCNNHDRWVYFFIRGHINKALRYSQDPRIQNYANEIPEFLRQPHIHKSRYKGGLVIQNYSISNTEILEYVLRNPICKKMIKSLCVYLCRYMRHLELSGHSENCHIQNYADHLELLSNSDTGSS